MAIIQIMTQKSLSEDIEYDETENSNSGAEEEAVNEPGNATVNVQASVDEGSEGLPQKKRKIKHCRMES
jgi:hypothetical protein